MNGARFRSDYRNDQNVNSMQGPIRTLAFETLEDNFWSAYMDDIRVYKGAFIPVPPAVGGFGYWQAEHFSSDERADVLISGPGADPDGDGILNLLEYALGANPRLAGSAKLPVLSVRNFPDAPAPGAYLTLAFRRPVAIEDVGYLVKTSSGLVTWESTPVLESVQAHEDGTATYLYRDATPLGENTRRFLRLEVELR
jgi:hypothetical protein